MTDQYNLPFLIPNIEGIYTVKDSKDRLVDVNCIKRYAFWPEEDSVKKAFFLVSYYNFYKINDYDSSDPFAGSLDKDVEQKVEVIRNLVDRFF